MPDRGDERGRGGTRTLVTGILAGTEWLPATNPQEATQTAREARDLAVRLRPVLSKLAQAPRGGRRRDLEWLPAVEQLAVDAQYFASWWLPRLEGKSAQSWPSWSADGYADWVKRLDAQRLRTLEMVEGTAPVTRIASVTQLRRGKGAAADADADADGGPAVEGAAAAVAGAEDTEVHSPARHAKGSDSVGDAEQERSEYSEHSERSEHSARITPLRGPGAALMDAALMDMAGAGTETGARETGAENPLPPVPRTPPNQGPGYDDPDATHVQRPAADSVPIGLDAVASDAAETAPPRVPRTPPNQGPAEAGSGGGAVLHIPRTPPNSGPTAADAPRAPVVSLVGDDEPRVPRIPPNSGPAEDDANATHISLAPVVPATHGAGSYTDNDAETDADNDADATHVSLAPAAPAAPSALDAGDDELTRPLFRSSPPVPPPSVAAPAAAAAMAGAAVGAGAIGSGRDASGTSGASGGSGASDDSGPSAYDEFENFQPGSDLPPPVFPMTEPVEPVDRGRIVRYALSAVVLAALCVLAFVGLTQKGSSKKTAAAATSSTSSPTSASSSASQSSANSGAVTAPTATDSAPVSSTASKPPASTASTAAPAKPTPPPSSAPKTSAAPASSAAPPSPPQSTHQQPPPASGGVRSLSISLAPDATGSYTYVAHVHVTTSGTGSVTVTVTFAGTATSGSPGSTGVRTQSFPLSGKTSYDIYAESDVHGMCIGSGEQPYIDAIASASGAGSSVAYASSPC